MARSPKAKQQSATVKYVARQKRRRLSEQLEDRVLFDAVVDDISSLDASADVDSFESTQTASAFENQDIRIDDAQSTSSVSTAREVVFVDTSIENLDTLLEGLSEKADSLDIVLLNPAQDGLTQIARHLEGSRDIAAIHLLAHGTEGSIQLGNTSVTTDQLETVYAGLLADIGRSLAADADFLIYGCDLAGNEEGTLFVDTLSRLTGSDVAASDDLTGNADLGGDWVLEYATGVIDTSVFVSASAQENWMGTLESPAGPATPVPTATLDVPEEVMINEPFQFTASFDNANNTDPSAVGYVPYIDLTIPDGIDIGAASYLGGPVNADSGW